MTAQEIPKDFENLMEKAKAANAVRDYKKALKLFIKADTIDKTPFFHNATIEI